MLLEAKLKVRHVTAKLLCKITLLLRHVVSVGLIRTMCGLFRATESRVAQSLVYE